MKDELQAILLKVKHDLAKNPSSLPIDLQERQAQAILNAGYVKKDEAMKISLDKYYTTTKFSFDEWARLNGYVKTSDLDKEGWIQFIDDKRASNWILDYVKKHGYVKKDKVRVDEEKVRLVIGKFEQKYWEETGNNLPITNLVKLLVNSNILKEIG